ncbi:MAG: hypothetical protein E4G91_11845 [Candidatus Zixiibacteriota bacterium]|nr:MAG: hypothetical protein E4G91_11845 [candidate division Zixibacteria bacterium]
MSDEDDSTTDMPNVKIDIVTVFPGMFTGFVGESMMARALAQDILSVNVHDLRDYTDDPHRSVDDTPFGGGGGMILMAEPIACAVDSLQTAANGSAPAVVIVPTARGKRFDQPTADKLAACPRLIFVCGHYTGVDERVFDYLNPMRLSIGDYILTGGELPVMVMVDAIARRIPGFLGNDESGKDDSFVIDGCDPGKQIGLKSGRKRGLTPIAETALWVLCTIGVRPLFSPPLFSCPTFTHRNDSSQTATCSTCKSVRLKLGILQPGLSACGFLSHNLRFAGVFFSTPLPRNSREARSVRSGPMLATAAVPRTA